MDFTSERTYTLYHIMKLSDNICSYGSNQKEVHRGIKLYRSKWMEPYINEELTKLRQQSQTAFKNDFFKLMNNYSVFLTKGLKT